MREGAPSRRAVFLDRDGTLIQDLDYLADPEGVVLLPGVVEALRLLAQGGFALVVVTNQSGIARGLYSLEDYRAVARRLDRELAREGLALDGTYFCPHHPDFTGPCNCRKPAHGMYLEAARELGLDLGASFFVGDRKKDVEPASAFGGRGILVRTGYGLEEEATVDEDVEVVDSLMEAAEWIGGRE
jgi:D-glycero-D-manno-heptose 1,7-bisphosphate phosphatase